MSTVIPAGSVSMTAEAVEAAAYRTTGTDRVISPLGEGAQATRVSHIATPSETLYRTLQSYEKHRGRIFGENAVTGTDYLGTDASGL